MLMYIYILSVEWQLKIPFISFPEGKVVVVLEAAILLRAGWEELCHEVWGCVIPVKEVGLLNLLQK